MILCVLYFLSLPALVLFCLNYCIFWLVDELIVVNAKCEQYISAICMKRTS
jgi:hypothetical protein